MGQHIEWRWNAFCRGWYRLASAEVLCLHPLIWFEWTNQNPVQERRINRSFKPMMLYGGVPVDHHKHKFLSEIFKFSFFTESFPVMNKESVDRNKVWYFYLSLWFFIYCCLLEAWFFFRPIMIWSKIHDIFNIISIFYLEAAFSLSRFGFNHYELLTWWSAWNNSVKNMSSWGKWFISTICCNDRHVRTELNVRKSILVTLNFYINW